VIRSSGWQSSRWLWSGLVVLLTFRLWFSAALPMTGDEGYFVLWGDHPAGGYYDHPPMVGWWLSGLLALSRAEWVLRLPAVLLPLALAWGGWWLVRPYGVPRARMAALLVLLQPVNVWNVLITTDTPVVLFSTFSVMAYVAALRCVRSSRTLAWHMAAGALLGLAFLSKYFAALLGFAYLVHVVFVRRDARRRAGLLFLLAAALPAPIYNLWWNSGHCWANILFNFVNRNTDAGFSWSHPLLYVVSVAYLATPWLLFELWRQRRTVGAVHRNATAGVEAGAIFWLALVPLGVFALMSFWRLIGLHWLVSFIPLPAVLAAIVLPVERLDRILKWSALFAALHVLVFSVMVSLPLAAWEGTRVAEDLALREKVNDVLGRLAPFQDDHLLATESYSASAFMAYKSGRPVAVFGDGSPYARQDDFETDWRVQDGRRILILRTKPPAPDDYRPYFRHVEFYEFVVDGTRFHLVVGEGFDYAVYHAKVLIAIRDRYYRLPPWLPQRGCEFCERYFPDRT
jgi:4-amino-4-deoxy-L-arabinose transferase-like glycosyltransferase